MAMPARSNPTLTAPFVAGTDNSHFPASRCTAAAHGNRGKISEVDSIAKLIVGEMLAK
jgi:hypothetical protein